MLIIGGFGSVKENLLCNLIYQQSDIEENYLYAKDLCEQKYQFLINKQESKDLKHFNDSKAFLNTRMIWMIFIKTLINTNQIKNVNY